MLEVDRARRRESSPSVQDTTEYRTLTAGMTLKSRRG